MISPPSGKSIFASPDRSVRSLPLASRAVVRPFWVSKLIAPLRSEEHTSELQSHLNLVCRLLLEKKKLTVPAEVLTCLAEELDGGDARYQRREAQHQELARHAKHKHAQFFRRHQCSAPLFPDREL